MFRFLRRLFGTAHRRVEHRVIKKTVETHMVWITDTFVAPQAVHVVYVEGPEEAFAVPKAIWERVKVGRQVFTFVEPPVFSLESLFLVKQPGEDVVDVSDS